MKHAFLRRALLFSVSTVLCSAAATAGDWPQWRGPERTGHASGAAALAALPKELAPLWKIAAGGGFSGPVVAGRTVVYLDENGSRETAHALDAATGRELWQFDYAGVFRDEWGAGPRATPIVDGDRVYVQSCSGEFRCLSLKDGKVIWGASYEKDYASTIAAGDRLLVLSESGQLVLLAANPEKYTELGRLQVCGNTWSFPAYADGKLFVRDGRQLLCLDLAAK